MKRLVLASSSPRRRKLLEQIGLDFIVDPSDDDEALRESGLTPEELVEQFSLRKARVVAARHPGAIVIAADTVGTLDGRTLGKPASPDEARQMLSALSGRTHHVLTAFTVIDTSSGKSVTRTVRTKVTFRKMTPEEIEAYVRTGEPLDKAGAYGIQELGAVFVRRIEGDYFSVVGLPLCELVRVLRKFGVRVIG